MQVIEQPNSDWIKPTRLELTMWQALTRSEGRPLSVQQWNDAIEEALTRWMEAREHTPQLADLCETLLLGLRISLLDYGERDFVIRDEE